MLHFCRNPLSLHEAQNDYNSRKINSLNHRESMKSFNILIITLMFASTVYAHKNTVVVNEYAAIDSAAIRMPESATASTGDIAAYIVDNFKSDAERVRAVFAWLTSNVEYDVSNMYALNFYEKREDKIARTLLTRKGICADYAAVFKEVCDKAGIKSYVIEGYTKQNGMTDYVPHAWNGARIDGTWYLFDATWGSGYIDNHKFTRKTNNQYFKAAPSAMIKSHMPFDYLWQFLNYPVSNQDFLHGNIIIDESKPYFSFIDSIAAYDTMSHLEQISTAAGRIERNGVKNGMIFERLQHLKLEIENTRQMETVNLYNSATSNLNESVNHMNDYINFKNKQFTPAKPDAEIQQMLTSATKNIDSARTQIAQIKEPGENVSSMIPQLQKTITDLEGRIKEEQTWLNSYLKKGKAARRSMFYTRVSMYGIPLN